MLARLAATAAMTSLIFLTSCVTKEEANQNAEKVYDTICTAEPLMYSIAFTVATAKEWPEKKIVQLKQAHAAVVSLCTNRPTDLITGLQTLNDAYTKVLAIKVATEKAS